ncbi:MAG TPA: amino acid ABC transporter substrate-binding protein [Methylomirabilota bacterium]|jgi:branched-chain amino acid transport system substrate-binding protein|nr:amino acid ABC transporter substrate-binding protein [Methylomirabilota bacterium]
MRRPAFVTILCATLLLPAISPPLSAQDKVVRLGAALSLTGPLASEGRKQQRAYELWRELVNAQGGVKVGGDRYRAEIKYYDYESKTPTATKLVEKLTAEDSIHFILGPFGSGATGAVSAITERSGATLIAPLASSEALYERGYKSLFGVLVPNAYLVSDFYDQLLAQTPKPRTLAIVHRNEFFPAAVAKDAKEAGDKRGLEVVYFEQFPGGSKDMAGWLTVVKSKSPDILIVTGNPDDLILVTKQAKELAVTPKVLYMVAGPAFTEYVEALKSDAEFVTTSSWWVENLPYRGPVFGSAEDFGKLWRTRFKEEADYNAAASSNAALLFQLAIEKAASIEPAKVRQALAGLDTQTFFGPVKFNDKGQNIAGRIALVQIQKGRRAILAPPDIATAKLVYPMPDWRKR